MHNLASCFSGLSTMAHIQHFSTSPYRKRAKSQITPFFGHMQLSKGHLESGLMLATALFCSLLKDPFPKSLSMGQLSIYPEPDFTIK